MSDEIKKPSKNLDPDKTGPVKPPSDSDYQRMQAELENMNPDELNAAEKSVEWRQYYDEVAASEEKLEQFLHAKVKGIPREHAGADTLAGRLRIPDDSPEALAAKAMSAAISDSEALRRRERLQQEKRDKPVVHPETIPPPPFEPKNR